MTSEFMSIGEAARYLEVDLVTLRRWGVKGTPHKIQEYRDARGRRWYKRADIERVRKERANAPRPVGGRG